MANQKRYLHKPTGEIYICDGAGGLIREDNSTNFSLPLWLRDNSLDWIEIVEKETDLYKSEDDKNVIYNSKTNRNICVYFDEENKQLLLKLLNTTDKHD